MPAALLFCRLLYDAVDFGRQRISLNKSFPILGSPSCKWPRQVHTPILDRRRAANVGRDGRGRCAQHGKVRGYQGGSALLASVNTAVPGRGA